MAQHTISFSPASQRPAQPQSPRASGPCSVEDFASAKRWAQPASPKQLSKSASRSSLQSSRSSDFSTSSSETGSPTMKHSASKGGKLTVTLGASNSLAKVMSRPSGDISKVVHQVQPAPNSQNAYREHLFSTFQALKFVKRLQPADLNQVAAKTVHLPPTTRKTVIFDLDETLVHCVQDPSQAHLSLSVPFPTGETVTVGVNIRPFARECLSAVSSFCEVIVFTASLRSYADKVLDVLDPSHTLISHRLYREHCVEVDGLFIKDLRVIAGRRLENLTLVDNSAYSFAYQLDNGVPIISWYEDASDRELCNLAAYLRQTLPLEDVRLAHRNTFRLHCFYDDYLRDFIRP